MKRNGVPLHFKILIGLFLGFALGLTLQAILGANNPDLKAWVDNLAKPVGKIFLNMIFMIVVPLLFSALVLGVAEIGDARKVGRVGLYSLLMTVLLSGTAVGIGLLAVNTVRPGDGITQEQRDRLMATYGNAADAEKKVDDAK